MKPRAMGGKTSGSVIRKLSVRRSRAGPELDQRARGTAAAAWRTRQAAQVRSVSLREKLTSGEPSSSSGNMEQWALPVYFPAFGKGGAFCRGDIRELFTTRGAALSRRARFRSPAVSGASGAEAGSFACGFGNGRSREKSLRPSEGKGFRESPFPGRGRGVRSRAGDACLRIPCRQNKRQERLRDALF